MPIGFGSDTEMLWSSPKITGDIPNKRSGHTLTIKIISNETTAYMFGGCDHKNPPGPTNDLYKLDIQGNNLIWSKIIPTSITPIEETGIPIPRWHHSAILYNKRLIIFGGFASQKRLNDLWFFDTETKYWDQPHPSSLFWENVPSCRGSHSATLINDKMYIFGGYGGNGYGRTDFNDIFILDLRTWKWEELITNGERPEPRSGHQACLVDKTYLYIIGGWNSLKQFDDVHILDLKTNTWNISILSKLSIPTWNHTCISVPAVPNWKIFMFGGNTGDLIETGSTQGNYVNTVSVLDTGTMTWSIPLSKGEPPAPRSDTSIIYDTNAYKMILFGGWANRWFNNTMILAVDEIVGPSYAISSITPSSGAITGNTKVIIKGYNFNVNNISTTATATIRFSVQKGFVNVNGTIIDNNTIELETPNFEKYGNLLAEVRVSMSGESLTNSALKYKFHSVTSAENSIAFGPAVIENANDLCIEKKSTTFIIQSMDKENHPRDSGYDIYHTHIKLIDNPTCNIPVKIIDTNDGLYEVTFIPPQIGIYEISVQFEGTFGGTPGHIRGSPYRLTLNGSNGNNLSIVSNNNPIHFENGKSLDSTEFIRRLASNSNKKSGDFRRILMDLRKDIPTNNDIDGLDALIKIRDVIKKIENDKYSNQLVLNQTSFMLNYIKKIGGHVDKEINEIENVKKMFDDVIKTVPYTEQKITGPTRIFSEKTEEKIEEYEIKIKQLAEYYKTFEFWSSTLEPDKALEKIANQIILWDIEMTTCNNHSHLCKIFGFPKLMDETLRIMNILREQMEGIKNVWHYTKEYRLFSYDIHKKVWLDYDPLLLQVGIQNIIKNIKKNVPKDIHWCDAYNKLMEDIRYFEKTHPLIRLLSSNYMRKRHWDRIMKTTGNFPTFQENVNQTLGILFEKKIHEHAGFISEVCYEAEKEQELEIKLIELENIWSVIEWDMKPYNENISIDDERFVPLLKISEESFELLENNQIEVQTMTSSPFQGEFEERVSKLQYALSCVNEVVVILGDIQRSWSYLEPLFIQSEEVKNQLPELTNDFKEIDIEVKNILCNAWKIKNVKNSCIENNLLKRLEKIMEKLELCKLKLKEFLDGRRRQFPRFYFMSEADLLDILSNGSKPENIMIHASKIYLATKTFKLINNENERPTAISFIAGVGKEEIDFQYPVKLDGEPEIYLEKIHQAMKFTLFKQVQISLEEYINIPRHEWINRLDKKGKPMDAAQIMLLSAGVHYVAGVEKAFNDMSNNIDKDALKKYNLLQEKQLENLIKLTQSKIQSAERQRVMVLITMDAHGRDIVSNMIRSQVEDASSFQWQSQLKHYFSPAQGSFLNRDKIFRGNSIDRLNSSNARAQILICDAGIPYDYEYLGNGPRLVITPLTDRIYVTATQALNLKMGCAPAGPAGTGKTETTKDLANAIGKACYVFNCSPEMDYKSLGNIFKGLASSGSWGCFDEFNRLAPEVLSVCTVQFKAVCDACRGDEIKFILENEQVALDPTVGAFITMNPGYLGRSELPEGLKALFRPMTVMVPDLVLICENMLMAEGFTQAKILASKFYGLYSLLGQLLSKQLHYDWGLRAVKSVLCVAGGFKREEPDMPEQDLLMRALRDFNIPKIVAEDNLIFFGLLGDLFPRKDPNIDIRDDPPRKKDQELEDMVKGACESLNNSPRPEFMLKVVQLSELLAIRHCVFIMGPPAAGKTQTWKTLRKTRELMLGVNMDVQDLNPKSVSTNELYGYIVLKTREWKDGLLSRIMRDLGSIVKENGEEDTNPKWIILDGDLDANWIESMNSVMDDNRMLTLASNERVPLKSHMRMIFEIRDLIYATPATVSRAGILYISSTEGYQWRCLIDSWLDKHMVTDSSNDIHNMKLKTNSNIISFTMEIRQQFQKLFDQYCEPTLRFIKKNCIPIVPVEDVTFIGNLLNMLDCLLSPLIYEDINIIINIFIFSCVWSFGSSLSLSDNGIDYSVEFSNWWKNTWTDVKLAKSASYTVFDAWMNPLTGKFDSWAKSPYFYTEIYHSPDPINQITVPTTETCSIGFWLENLVRLKAPIMVCGPAGTGKTQNVVGILKKLVQPTNINNAETNNTSLFKFTTINFNYYTSSSVLQQVMGSSLEKKTGINYGPPGKNTLIYFIDDLNLPEVDPYGTQSAISLLRQTMEYKHWFERNKLQLQNIQNTQVIAGMNPTAGSFLIDPRLQRHFCTFAIGMPGPNSLVTIYETFLGGHLSNFDAEISSNTFWSTLIKAALALHHSVSCTFRKTASNFHYEFNIRHLSNVFQGLIASKKEKFHSAEKFIHLWLHESERVYGDRLVCPADIDKYNSLAQVQAKKSFPSINAGRFYAQENAWPLIFCHFNNSNDLEYDQMYSTNLDELKHILNLQLIEYNNNENNKAMHLDLFDDAIRHVARIVRILRNESGHALLVGVGGSGKRSLARLASYICGCIVKEISISSKYGENEFKDDLRKMYYAVADILAKNEDNNASAGVIFMLTDSQITNEKFLIYINDLLASGEVTDLFGVEDIDAICGQVQLVANTKERSEVWKFFMLQARKRLHLCLCFSPVGDDFRNRARKFPALVNCTVIDWFQPWPKEALLSVGREKLKDVREYLGNDESRIGIENFMPFSFSSVNECAIRFYKSEKRYVYTTPKSYLELLQLYKKILTQKLTEYDNAITRLEKGLQKLKETSDTVSQLEEELKVKLEAAEEKKAIASGIAETVNREKLKVEIESKKANEEAAKCAIIQADVTEKQRSTSEDLAKAEPAVEQAMQALDTLNKKDLGECKTMSKPPQGVDDVFAATMVLLAGIHPNIVITKTGKVKDTKWDACKKQILGNIPEYVDYLIKYKSYVDDGNVPVQNWKEVRDYLKLEYFNAETIATKNKAAAGLCNWVVNIVMYYDILITVEPKRQALLAANLELEAANKRLSDVTSLVTELQLKLDTLMAEAAAANKEKEDAIQSVEAGNRKMKLAGMLTNDLGSEGIRWKENVLQMQKEQNLLIGDALLASAFISYIGPFTKPFRDELINKHWVPFLRTAANGQSIAMSLTTNPVYILTNDAEIAKWNTQTLPADRVSTENGAIVVSTVIMGRRPLIIDPQLQAISWIKEMESKNNLQIVRVGQKRWIDRLKTAIGTDSAFLIENLEEKIDAILSPIIQRAKTRKGQRDEITIGDTSVPYNDKFRLYLHTKLSNPHYPPEIQAECTIVNFTVTSLGLEDQLLNLVVSKERKDLAIKRQELIHDQNQGKIELKNLEDTILSRLASAEGDITENQPLIHILSETKHKAGIIATKMEAGKKMQENLNISSEKYRPIAARGALLFFFMNDLFKVHSYYIYSLAAYTRVFLSGIDKIPLELAPDSSIQPNDNNTTNNTENSGTNATSNDEIVSNNNTDNTDNNNNNNNNDMTDEQMAERCTILMESITNCIYNYVRRGLFERDKLIVASMLCLKILLKNNILTQEEIDYFLITKISSNTGHSSTLSEWLPHSCWLRLKGLESMKIFHNLTESMQNDSDDWRKWFDAEDAETIKIPGEYDKSLSDFHKIILLRAIRPDRVTNALRTFISKIMGEKYINQPPFNMSETYNETSPTIPIFFVLFPGVEPTPWVEGLGKSKNVSLDLGNLINISMGQGQESYASESLKRLASEGGWIILQNVHLMQGWLPILERLLEEIENPHDNFRCFISAEPPPLPNMLNIPESLMQSCIKVANEAPSDIRSNLRRAWANFSQDHVTTCNKPNEYKACLFSLCWFHAIVLGRRRFGQQGWSRAYSFNTGDLTICANILHTYLNNNIRVPWDDLRYIFGEIMYGGHITDAWDRRTNNTYLKVLLHPKLMENMELGPGFKSPNPDIFLLHTQYANYIEKDLGPEVPPLFGLHPNAEIGYLTTMCETLCETILITNGGSGGSNDTNGSSNGAVIDPLASLKSTIDDLENRCPPCFNTIELQELAKNKMMDNHGPFVVVALQECMRMNILLDEIRISLSDLKKGLNGQLNMSQSMEDLAKAFSINQVPGRNPFSLCSWEKKAWPSRKSLSSWYLDMLQRYEQFKKWAIENQFITPYSLWLPGLFNPTAYTTACLQVTSRKKFMPLNQMTIETHITTFSNISDINYYPEDGVFVHGLLLEGARWMIPDEIITKYKVGNEPSTECGGVLMDSYPKELLWSLPVVYVKAVQTKPSWEPSSVGYLRHDPTSYECPVYITRFRGPTYVFLATLPTDNGVDKWILRGVAILFQDDN